MADNTTKKRKVLKIVLVAVVSILFLCVLLISGIFIHFVTPHTKHFDSVYLVSNNKFDGEYLYYARCNGSVSFLKSRPDLTTVFVSNGEDEYDLGEQDVKVKAVGIDRYRTDISGFFASYPVIVYEYVGK